MGKHPSLPAPSGLGGVTTSDSVFHAPLILPVGHGDPLDPAYAKYGNGGFSMRCYCGARGRVIHGDRSGALASWGSHLDRYERKHRAERERVA